MLKLFILFILKDSVYTNEFKYFHFNPGLFKFKSVMNLLVLVCYQKENLPCICGHDLPALVLGRTA